MRFEAASVGSHTLPRSRSACGLSNTAEDEIGFTVLSSKGSELFYSSRWVLSGKNAWQTVTQTFTGGISVQ